MKTSARFALAVGLVAPTSGVAAVPDRGKILSYIHKAWPS